MCDKKCDKICDKKCDATCTSCDHDLCFTLPINFTAIPQDDLQTATFTNTRIMSDAQRWQITNVAYPRVTVFKDEDIFVLDAKSCTNDFSFTANYNYCIGNMMNTVAINPCSDSTPISYGEDVTMVTSNITIFDIQYNQMPAVYFDPATSSDVTSNNNRDTLIYNFNDQVFVNILQVHAESEIQVSLNKRLGYRTLNFKVHSCGCITVLNIPPADSPPYKNIYVNGELFASIRFAGPI
jgi:hypothetical protein